MAEQNDRDELFAQPRQTQAFRFDQSVAAVFADMVERSVPGYPMVLEMTGVIAEQYVPAGGRCYDLGCSLGATTLAVRHHLTSDQCTLIAVDNSEAMVARCRELVDADDGVGQVEVLCQDILDTDIVDANLVALNYTLQFIPLAERLPLLSRIAAGLQPGGVLVLSEKVAFEAADTQAVLTDLHHGFKRGRGYSDLEIAQKRAAIDNVLIPETIESHLQRLREAGFQQVDVWFQCFNFVSILACK